MKKIILLLLSVTLLYITTFSQVAYENVYVELYINRLDLAFITDIYEINLYGNALYNDSVKIEPNDGFFINYMLTCENEGDKLYIYNLINKSDNGVVKIKVWDTKLYGYCIVTGVEMVPSGVRVTVMGVKNVPTRKKLLFKDSPSKRMWALPWLGN